MSSRLAGIAAFLLFALLGPPLGGLLYVGIGLLWSLASDPPDSLSDILQLGLFVALFSFVFGGVPAMLIGMWVGLQVWLGRHVGFVQIGLVGVLSCLAFVLFLALEPVQKALRFSQSGAKQMSDIIANFVFIAPFGLVSAVLCLWLCRRLGLVIAPRPA